MSDTRSHETLGPLHGLKVVDFGQLVAGPMSATLLADFGADVIKVERPVVGDPIRAMGPQKDGVSLWWKVNGRNKRTIALDLKAHEDVATFRRLVEEADVVVENFAPGTAASLGLDYETIRTWKPSIIYLSVSGFGQTGPRSKLKGFGRTAEAFSGMSFTTGHADRPPLHMAFPVADTVSGVFGAMAIMIAVYERDRNPDGLGQYIDIALYESIFRLMELPPIIFDQLGIVTQRTGAQSTYVAPVNTWKTGDGKWASFTGSTQSMVARLFEAIDEPALIEDPRFCSNEARLANAVELDSLLEKWMLDHTLDEVLDIFEKHDLAIAPVLSIEDIFAEDHFWQRGALTELDDPDLGAVRSPGIMPTFSRTPGAIRWLGRRLDDDRAEILKEWLGE